MGSRKKLYRGRGLGLASGPDVPILAFEKRWFYNGKMNDLPRIVGQVLQN